MLPKQNRLTPRSAVLRVIRTGRVQHSAALMIWSTIDRQSDAIDQQASQCAIVVGKKVAKSACARNRLKRRLRAILVTQLHTLPPNTQLVIAAKPQARMLTFAELEKQVVELIARHLSILR